MWYANFRVEKMIPMGERGRAYMTADVFNLFNSHTMNRRGRLTLALTTLILTVSFLMLAPVSRMKS
jgi:hypothetical protein